MNFFELNWTFSKIRLQSFSFLGIQIKSYPASTSFPQNLNDNLVEVSTGQYMQEFFRAVGKHLQLRNDF